MGGDKDDDDEYGGMMGMSGKGGKKITTMDLRCTLCINDRRVL
jgi:hypothetical protein